MDEPPPYLTPPSTASSRSDPRPSRSDASISRSRSGREKLRASAEAMLRDSLARRTAPSTISDQPWSSAEPTPSSTANNTAVRETEPPSEAWEADSAARRISFAEDPAMLAAMTSAADRARLAASLRLPASGSVMTTTRTRERLRQAEAERDEALRAHEIERRIAERLKREGEVGPSATEAELRILRFKYDAMKAAAQMTEPPPAGLFKTACSTDLMFLIDTTSSMSPYIEAAKNQVRSIVDDIKVAFLNEADVCVGIVSYKDHGDDPNIEFLDFTPDVDKVHVFLSNLKARGGRDLPEDVLGGLQQALNASWRHQTRCIIHIADAPPHGTALHDMGSDRDDYPGTGSEPHGLTHEPLLQRMLSLKINYALLRITHATDKMAYVFLKAYAQAAPEGKLDPSNKYYRDAQTLTATVTATRVPAGSSRAGGGGPCFEETKLGTTYSALRHLVVQRVTMSASRTAVRMSAARGPRRTGDNTAARTLVSISEGDDPTGVELETTAPRWHDADWLDEVVTVKAYSTDVAMQHCAGTLDSMMAHDDNIKISTTELTIRKRSQPFAQGAMRLAAYAQTCASTNQLVVKSYKRDGKRLADLAEDMRCQALCKAFALEFNSMLGERYSVDFVVVTCLEPKSSADFNGECMSLEPLLQGDYVKYNSNCGYVYNEHPDDPFHHAAQAFSHFSFERSRGAFLVADLQGVNHVLTDPVIHTRDPNRFRLSDGNLGDEGVKFFFATHECNPVCRKLGLKSSAAMIMSGSLEFRTSWPTNSSSGSSGMACCCSNKLCSRIVRLAKAQTSPEFAGYYWCDTCWPQLRSSTVKFICIAPNVPHHEFDLSRFFYESQGRIMPRRCPEHRAGADFMSRTAAVGLHVASRRSRGGEQSATSGGIARHITGGVSIFSPRTDTQGGVS
ncbi:hypothetical protein B0T26DRAFT_700601 [Lasiosphaeria miniovina]|uniref:Alpha-type protein kinase domain-containing protein n=1 Tax=Lasiosphaeria miniovina TaxID=1954250 RepID=A0AA40ATT1_9PEZI|nr:uncharacterized protein B0T26DRAFT_700601 [Lasiosphaeria miniovina]KAK0721888.1 hypothetical protein B0T26DRAFT_700601 [Lasiosphaeria miniovina]